MGNANSGRIPEWDKEAVANKLIEWAKKDDSLNLNHFCCTHIPPIPPSYIVRWSKDSDVFCQAYEIAKSQLGHRRERKLKEGELHVKAYDLNAATYDYFLKQEKRDQAEHEASLKNQDNNKPQEVVFKVNYDKSNDSIKISPETLPNTDTPSSK